MKILENGKLREMTEKEIKQHKEQEEKIRKELGIVDGYVEPTFENFIIQLSQVKKPDDVIRIAKEFSNKLHGGNEVQPNDDV